MKLGDVVTAFGLAADALGRVDGDQTAISELRSGLAELKRVESRLGAQLARLTHAADRRNAHVGTGARDTAEWLGRQTGTSTRKNRTAAQLGDAMAKSDELADAVASGELSTDKAAAAVGAAGGQPLDAEVIERLGEVPLGDVRPTVDSWRAEQDPDRERERAAERRSRRYLHLTDTADGMTRVDGLLDPTSAASVRTTLDAIMNESAADGTDRTRDQRRADALTQLAVAASKGHITGGRSNAKVLVTAPYETVCERADAPGRSHAGPSIDADAVRAMCCDAGMHRVITGPGSSILDFGHETRLVSENLFLALVARDHHCRWPGCTIRATWCDAHHVTEWLDGGPTSEANCALLCAYHHSVSHLPGWSLTGDGHEFVIHHPDGTIQVSRPPRTDSPRRGHRPSTTTGDPPDAPTLRADSIGRERSDEAMPVRQLALV